VVQSGDPAHVDRLIRSLTRARAWLLVLAIVLPLGYAGLVERHAHRLDALAQRGVAATAEVTDAHSDWFKFAYDVAGTQHTGSADQNDPRRSVGDAVAITYDPQKPTFARPGDRATVGAKAASNRSFGWKVAAGVFYFFAANLVLTEVRLRRLRRTRRTEHDDPRAYLTRIVLSVALLVLPALAAVTSFHLADALARGEPAWVVVVPTVFAIALLVGTGAYVLRRGHAHVGSRSERLLRWVVPIAVLVAIVRALLWLAARH
jgi:hypothetical protein